MAQHYRYKTPGAKGKQNDPEVPLTKMKEVFPWAAKADTSKGQKEAPEETGRDSSKAADAYLTEVDVNWRNSFEKKRTNYNVEYAPLYEGLKESYNPNKVLAAGLDKGAMSSKQDVENIFGSKNSRKWHEHYKNQYRHGTDAENPVEKARDRLRVSRGRVEMHEEELKGKIPNSDLFHSKRRGTLAAVLYHNFCICDLKLASRASDDLTDDMHAIVNVVAEQADELLMLIEQLCNAGKTTETNRFMFKDYAIALRDSIQNLLQLDGCDLGWVSVRKAVQKVAGIAQKTDSAVIFLEHHTENDEFGIPPVLPVSLRLRKKREQNKQDAQRQRSRIDEYFFQSIPEVQREAALLKKQMAGLSQKEREQKVLKSMTTYKKLSNDIGVNRMGKSDEIKVHQAIVDIASLQRANAEEARRNALVSYGL